MAAREGTGGQRMFPGGYKKRSTAVAGQCAAHSQQVEHAKDYQVNAHGSHEGINIMRSGWLAAQKKPKGQRYERHIE